MEPGTYIRPHRHRHTFELLLPLKGRFVVLNFDDHGVVTNRVVLGETCTALEMEAGTWHTVLSLDAGGMVFEVKQGAYQPLAEIDTMDWATLREAVAKLTPRERQIMELRYGLNDGTEHTQKEVADQIGISQSYISRLEKRIIHTLKVQLENE